MQLNSNKLRLGCNFQWQDRNFLWMNPNKVRSTQLNVTTYTLGLSVKAHACIRKLISLTLFLRWARKSSSWWQNVVHVRNSHFIEQSGEIEMSWVSVPLMNHSWLPLNFSCYSSRLCLPNFAKELELFPLNFVQNTQIFSHNLDTLLLSGGLVTAEFFFSAKRALLLRGVREATGSFCLKRSRWLRRRPRLHGGGHDIKIWCRNAIFLVKATLAAHRS